jgi:hypothetical protein
MGGGKKKEYTVGYRYYATVHMALCHGPINNINRIIVGDKQVWNGTIKDGSLYLNLPNLFGGENSEGGIAGGLDVMSGEASQGQNGYLMYYLGGNVPAYRGIVSVVLKSFMICSMNPYPKPWRFRVSRFPTPFGSSNYNVISQYFSNPAMIIADCLLNQSWGLGVQSNDLDQSSFMAVAQVLYNEGFGLCARWDQKQSLEDFIGEICQIIDGQLQMDPTSGKYALKLIRPDYNVETLMTLGPSEIVSLTEFSRPDPKELVNEVTVVFEDFQTGVEQSITEKNTAALALNPAINAVELRFQSVPTQSLARRIAVRELTQYSVGLATCSLEANRKAATLKMGDCFVLNWPQLGIDKMVMRVTKMAQGASTDWRVRLDCLQDINGIADTQYSEVVSGWTPPNYDPQPLTDFVIYEIPYYMVGLFITGDNDSGWSDLPPGFGYFAVVATQPAGTTIGIHINTLDSYSVWTSDRSVSFTEYGRLISDIDDVITSFIIAPGIIHDTSINEPILIDDEWMILTAHNTDTNQITVARGAMDTVPTVHLSNAIVWFTELYDNTDPKVYVTGQTVSTKLQPYSPTGEIPIGNCPTRTYVMKNRCARPVAPANIRVNGSYRPKYLASWASTLAWSRRDRQDTAKIRINTDGDFVPEADTLYNVVIREKLFPDSAWTAASTTNNLPYTTISLDLNGKYTKQAYSLEISLSATLNSLASWQTNIVTLIHSNWVIDIINMTTTAPPGSQTTGNSYIIPSGATGQWAGKTNQIAKYKNSGWYYYSPQVGDKINNLADSTIYQFDGTNWEAS